MSTTLAQLRTAVKRLIGDQAADNDEIDFYLNEGQKDLAQISRTLTIWPVAVVANDVSVSKPTDASSIKEIYFDYGSYRVRLKIKYGLSPEISTVVGLPEYAYVIGSLIYLYPASNQAGTLQVLGVARPTDMSGDSDTPSIEDADGALIVYATHWLALAYDDKRASRFEKMYDRKKLEWSILNAQANPMAQRFERESGE